MRLSRFFIMSAVVLAASVWAFEIRAQFCPMTLAAVELRIREAVPAEALEIERHAGPEVSAVVARLNAEPPVTDFVADSVLIAYWLGQPGAVVVLGRDGCVAGQITLPAMRARTLFGQTS
ncbi:MAG: hypothetical protein JNL04_00155 [Rhodospirillaceae bacterium]|nr:hypothetical protein [Rhodospirillaceae bacterium]